MWKIFPRQLHQISKSRRHSIISFKSGGVVDAVKTGLSKSRPLLDSSQAGLQARPFSLSKNWRSTSSQPQSPTYSTMASLETLNFDNLVLRSLPIDRMKANMPRKVPGACFSLVDCTPVSNPEVVAYSGPALRLLDLPEIEAQRPEFAEYFSGNKQLPGSETAAHCYCGHQFGYFAGQLGDGAAIYLGEVVNKAGERWEFQIKGAGKTPFSRTADGRKVLRSSIREFLCSEAMHHLGIPTTRAGACVTSDTKVIRDIFYDGKAIQEKATIVLRMAPTFIRFGSFEIFKKADSETGKEGPSAGRVDILEQLTDYVISTFYPEILEQHKADKKQAYLEFYRRIVQTTAQLVAKWQCVGWCHGVLNTDNMSIVGLTMDYGPYGFLDRYESGFICNTSDTGGRYAYDKQPDMCKWNCMKLAEALEPLVSMEETRPILDSFDQVYAEHYLGQMRKKLGLLNKTVPEDEVLVESLLETMEKTGADFTNVFRGLAKLPLPGSKEHESGLAALREHLLAQCCPLAEMKRAWKPRMDARQLQMFVSLLEMNPTFLSQLGMGHRAILQEIDRVQKTKELQSMTQTKKTEADTALWAQWLQTYAHRLNLEAEASDDVEAASRERARVMNQNNPRFILRNYIAQTAIEAAEKGDYSEVQHVLKLLENPYSEETSEPSELTDAAAEAGSCRQSHSSLVYDGKPPAWASELKVT